MREGQYRSREIDRRPRQTAERRNTSSARAATCSLCVATAKAQPAARACPVRVLTAAPRTTRTPQYSHLKLTEAVLPGRSVNTTTPSRSICTDWSRMLRSFAFTVMFSVGYQEWVKSRKWNGCS